MKLIERQPVEGTDPQVYLGRREYTGKDGAKKVTTTCFCEYCIHGRPVQHALKTPNKQLAVCRVHELVSRIDAARGTQSAPASRFPN